MRKLRVFPLVSTGPDRRQGVVRGASGRFWVSEGFRWLLGMLAGLIPYWRSQDHWQANLNEACFELPRVSMTLETWGSLRGHGPMSWRLRVIRFLGLILQWSDMGVSA